VKLMKSTKTGGTMRVSIMTVCLRVRGVKIEYAFDKDHAPVVIPAHFPIR